MNKTAREKIKDILTQNFEKSDKAKFYFVKGLKEYSSAIVIKSKKDIDRTRIDQIKILLKIELKNPLVDLLEWIDTVGGLIPKKNVYKIPFFDTEELKEYNPWRVCPIGEHWVRRHDRQKKHLEDVDGHCRKNPKGKDILKGDEVDLISNSDLFSKVTIKVSPILMKFPNCDLYDGLISGWTAYWNAIFKVTPPLHPNFVKALIASESGFNPNAINPNNPKRIGPARGQTQITVVTQKSLSGEVKDLKDHFVMISDDEIFDASKNICAGTRWLFRKRETAKARLKREPTWEEVLMEYKGRLTSKSQDTQNIRDKLKEYLRELDEQ